VYFEVHFFSLYVEMENTQAGKEYMGVIKSWRTDKGFGFVTSDEDGKDLFVHQSAIVIEGSAYRAVLPGTKVIFSVQIRDGKETAVNVKVPLYVLSVH
jgi:cold shock CspA family protein